MIHKEECTLLVGPAYFTVLMISCPVDEAMAGSQVLATVLQSVSQLLEEYGTCHASQQAATLGRQ